MNNLPYTRINASGGGRRKPPVFRAKRFGPAAEVAVVEALIVVATAATAAASPSAALSPWAHRPPVQSILIKYVFVSLVCDGP